jgi:hypothetical protein
MKGVRFRQPHWPPALQSVGGGMAKRPGPRPEKKSLPFRRKTNAPRGWLSGSLRRVAVLSPYRSAPGGQVGPRSRSLERPGYPPRPSTPDGEPSGGPRSGPAPPARAGGPPLHPLPPPLRIAGRASLPATGRGECRTGTTCGANLTLSRSFCRLKTTRDRQKKGCLATELSHGQGLSCGRRVSFIPNPPGGSAFRLRGQALNGTVWISRAI